MARKVNHKWVLKAEPELHGLKKFAREVKKLNRTLAQFKEIARAAFAIGGVVSAASAQVQRFMASVAQMATAVADMAAAAGIGQKHLQVLGYLATQSGTSLEAMSQAVIKLGKAAQDAAQGNGRLADRFKRLGIDIRSFKDLSPERQMERLGLAVATASDKQAVLAEVMALIGQDAGPKLMESLRKLGVEGYDQISEHARDSGQVMSEESVAALARADQALKDFGSRWKIVTGQAVASILALYDQLNSQGSAERATERIMAAGLNDRTASALLRSSAEFALAEGRLHDAEMALLQAQEWLDRKDQALARRAALGLQESRFAGGMEEHYRKQAAWQESLHEKLAAARDRHHQQQLKVAEAQQQAARMAHEAHLAQILAADEVARQARQAANLQEAKQEQALREKIMTLARQKTLEHLAEQQKAISAAQQAMQAAMPQSDKLRTEAHAFYAQLEFLQANTALGQEEINRATAHYIQLLDQANALLSEERSAAAFEALNQQTKAVLAQFEGFGQFIEGNLTNAVRDFVTTGTMDMKKLGQTILDEVIMSMLKALVLKPMLGGIGGVIGGAFGGAIGGAFGGMRAGGGPVTRGTSYLVGERGPELFMPQTSGVIIDANKTAQALAGDTASVAAQGPENVYQIDARGADQGAVARLEAALFKLAGPGVVEKRARAAEADRTRRG